MSIKDDLDKILNDYKGKSNSRKHDADLQVFILKCRKYSFMYVSLWIISSSLVGWFFSLFFNEPAIVADMFWAYRGQIIDYSAFCYGIIFSVLISPYFLFKLYLYNFYGMQYCFIKKNLSKVKFVTQKIFFLIMLIILIVGIAMDMKGYKYDDKKSIVPLVIELFDFIGLLGFFICVFVAFLAIFMQIFLKRKN